MAIPILETERLILRAFGLGDAPEVQRLAGDKAIADGAINVPHPYEDGMAEEWISTHQAEFSSGHAVTFAIVLKDDGQLIGAIGLREITEDGRATLGYWVGKPYWNRGFCTEAATAVIDYAFAELGVVLIEASHLTNNPASGRVMQKLGMRYEGTQTRFVAKWNRTEGFEIYTLAKEDWPGPVSPPKIKGGQDTR